MHSNKSASKNIFFRNICFTKYCFFGVPKHFTLPPLKNVFLGFGIENSENCNIHNSSKTTKEILKEIVALKLDIGHLSYTIVFIVYMAF